MTWGTIKVRNACPFSVTFYALAGPTIELPPMTTGSAKACLIWFSTRVKGPGDTINQDQYSELADEYRQDLEAEGHDASEWEDGGSGAAAGSFLGFALTELRSVFSVKNTEDTNLYFGAKKEGVYGKSDLVVYATLDPACSLRPQPPGSELWWHLHLEKDEGQTTPPIDTDPMYAKPDLSKYDDGFFFRLRNKVHNVLMYAEPLESEGDKDVNARQVDSPFNPLTMAEYWSVHPEPNDSPMAMRIMNTANQTWLTCFSNYSGQIGQVSSGTADYDDQHWTIDSLSESPQLVQLRNSEVAGTIVWNTHDGHVFMYPPADSNNENEWLPETFFVNVNDLPDGVPFRLMHANDGKYITTDSDDGSTDLKSYADASSQLYQLERSGEYYLITQGDGFLGFDYGSGKLLYMGNYTEAEQEGIYWSIRADSANAGFYLVNKHSGLQLYYKDGGWGLYNGDYDDQLFVAQI